MSQQELDTQLHCNCTRYARTHGKLDSHVCTSGIRRKTTSAYWSTGSSVDANTFMLCLWSRGLILCQIRRRWVDDCGWIHASFVPRGCPFPGCRLIDAWRYVDLTGHHKSISTFVRLNTGINAHAQTHERVADTAAHTKYTKAQPHFTYTAHTANKECHNLGDVGERDLHFHDGFY